jgi:hypothetical protein
LVDGDTGERWDEDPGWQLRWRTMGVLIPYSHLLYRRRARGDPLVNLRYVWLSFPGSLVTFGLVIPFVLPLHGDSTAVLWVVGIGVLTLVYFAVTPRIGRPLPCDSDHKLATAYRARMFMRIAYAESTALFGFVAAFLTSSGWAYYVCVLFSLPGLMRAAPTNAALIREQDELTARGCDRSLVAAIRRTPTSSK